MVSERELVGLLHRADWTKLTLSGTVRGPVPVIDSVADVAADEPLSSPCTLSVAPGRRFRAEAADGAWAVGSDGARLWHWFRDRPAGVLAGFDDRPGPPYRALLAPSWLLTGYSLVPDGEVTVAGRAGVRVLGTLRPVVARTTGTDVPLGGGGFAAPIPRWLSPWRWNEVEAVVDAELGILLRCSERSGDGLAPVIEFSSVDVPGAAGASAFTAPPGSVSGGAGASPGDALGGGVAAALGKTVAGMWLGGLGALIRYAPRRRVNPFAQATAEATDPEAEMPADEPAPSGPGDAAAPRPGSEALADEGLPDEVLHLVYRSGLTAPAFSATLHQWSDRGAALAAVPQPVRDWGFGGVGFLVDTWLRDPDGEAGVSHEVIAVRMDGWEECRIDGEAGSAPRALADLVDASWLLYHGLALSGGTEVRLGGRRAYRIVARYREETLLGSTGWVEQLFFPAVAVVDAETGLVLRLTRFRGGRAAMRQELRDVEPTALERDVGLGPGDRAAQLAEKGAGALGGVAD